MATTACVPDSWATIGILREQQFVVAAMQQGWFVYQALHPQAPYDFVIDRGNGAERVEVKSCHMRKPAPSRLKERPDDRPRLICDVRRSSNAERYGADAWDLLAAVTADGDVYLIPRHVVGDRHALSFMRGDYDEYILD